MALGSVIKGFFLLLVLITCMIGTIRSDDDHDDDDSTKLTKFSKLSARFYDKTCPKALRVIEKTVREAVSKENRMGASLLRLHFHDCFVQGCDASVLLDDTANFTGEKKSFPNANSLRGFEIIDDIKSQLELMCPNVVSCSDILTLAARDAIAALGGQRWNVLLGRRDSTTASLDESNSDLPGPHLDLNALITAFDKKGFSTEEMVTLSGGHTIGKVRCRFFRTRIYNETNIDPIFAALMQAECPFEGGDDNLSNFDTSTPLTFDNGYYQNLMKNKGLVHSDQQLFGNGTSTNAQVRTYSRNMRIFKRDFANAMFKMTMLSPLTGTDGQIRQNCRVVNPPPADSTNTTTTTA